MGRENQPQFQSVRLSMPDASGSKKREAAVPIALGSGRFVTVNPKTWVWDFTNLYAEDIAGSLSNLCRFTGGCKKFYSVAEHSVIGYRMTKDPWWLFHDSPEGLGLGDVNSMLKAFLGFDVYNLAHVETEHQVALRFGVTRTDIHVLDKALGNYEARVLTGIPLPVDFSLPYLPVINCWDPLTARKEWLKEYEQHAQTRR